jgi:hypothetical protein
MLAPMEGPWWFEVLEWTPYEVVAGDDGSDGCVKATITISRKTKELLWVEEPVNQTRPFCKDERHSNQKALDRGFTSPEENGRLADED